MAKTLNPKKRNLNTLWRYVLLIAVGFVMIYPLLWMIGATFKSNQEIFSSIWFIPQKPTLDGWRKVNVNYGGQINIIRSMVNTYKIVIPKVIFTLISSTLAAYGFARFNFRAKKILFPILISTLFLPQVVLNIPQYIMYAQFGWIDSAIYAPLIIPSLFATDTLFVFMLIQFLRGIPVELEEAANIDGCNVLGTLWYIIVPMLIPALVSIGLFQFMWTNNDFMGPLLYINTPARYTASIFVKLSMDADVGFEWNRVLAVSLISIIPSLIVFFAAQDQFVEGIAAGGVKG